MNGRARALASLLGNEYVEPGHLLIALIEDAALEESIMVPLGVSVENARARAMALLEHGPHEPWQRSTQTILDSHQTLRIRVQGLDQRWGLVPEGARERWRAEIRAGRMPEMGHDAEPEHLLLALLAVHEPSAGVLAGLGAQYDAVRELVARMPIVDDDPDVAPKERDGPEGDPESLLDHGYPVPEAREAAILADIETTARAAAALGRARSLALSLGHECVAPTHLLVALLQDDALAARLEDLGIAVDEVRTGGLELLGSGPGSGEQPIRLSRTVLIMAIAATSRRERIDAEDLLVKLVEGHEPTARRLRRYGVRRWTLWDAFEPEDER